MKNSSDSIERAKGFAYEAEACASHSNHAEAAFNYIASAAIAHNNPVYYGYASNEIFKSLSTHIKDLSFGVITAHRAINIDFFNPRWHYYAGLAVTQLGMNIIQWNEDFAHALVNGGLDEFRLASAYAAKASSPLKHAIDDAIKQQNNSNYFRNYKR